MKRLYPLDIKNSFYFRQTPKDFTVEEIPLYPPSGKGEHLLLKVRKKELTTWELLGILASHTGIKKRDIGYAGLKDKHALTVQYLSIPSRYKEALSTFAHPKIKILEVARHHNKLRTGHLKANRFFIRLKKVDTVSKTKIESALNWINKNGMPNYFGMQRFGTKGDNWSEGKRLIEGRLKIRDIKTKRFLTGAYQSYLFNRWLAKRIELSLLAQTLNEQEIARFLQLPSGATRNLRSQSQFLKLLEGDVMMHYPFGKLFLAESLCDEALRFANRDVSLTGLLPGAKTVRAQGFARLIEAPFDKDIPLSGVRRYAWVWPEQIEGAYIESDAHFELRFTLPKGSYATVLIETLLGRNLEEA